MNKFALVGKNIAHSRSPEMYRKLISPDVQYDLLDYSDESEIPSALELLSIYDGINITSPYKKHFLSQVTLTESARELEAINCLKKREDKIFGENTDYLAILEILSGLKEQHVSLDVIVLGDGVMSFVAQTALKKLNIKFEVCSRKLTKDFNQLNLLPHFRDEKARPLIINTCSRDYVFTGNLPSNALFWDFNYNFMAHEKELSSRVSLYMDGLSMLERQAFYAVSFWSNRKLF